MNKNNVKYKLIEDLPISILGHEKIIIRAGTECVILKDRNFQTLLVKFNLINFDFVAVIQKDSICKI